jgi:hypothetical protein
MGFNSAFKGLSNVRPRSNEIIFIFMFIAYCLLCIICPSTTNVEEEEMLGALGNDGNSSMPEHVSRPNP